MRARLAAFMLVAGAARGTTIDPMLWQELVAGADFVGVVECTEAGGIVARYRVVETWKGAETPGSSITIAEAVNYWEPQYPLSLVGERAVVTAYRSHPESRILSTTSGRPVPLWWRDLPSDYRLPLFQGKSEIPASGTSSLIAVGYEEGTLEAFKGSVTAFVALGESARELAVMKARARKYGTGWDDDGGAWTRTMTRVQESTTLQGAVDAMIGDLQAMDEPARRRLASFIARSGDATVDVLEDTSRQARGANAHMSELLQGVRERRRDDAVVENDDAGPAPAPSTAEIQRLSAMVSAGPSRDSRPFDEAVDVLLRVQPEPVVTWLAAWTPTPDERRAAERGHIVGSSIAVRLGVDRSKHLKALLKANDPQVRAAAAVYLAFDEPLAGRAALRRASEMAGDPGAWCALALARRGERSAIPRLQACLAEPNDGAGMDAVPHRNLVKRVLELTSNSAARAGLPQPAWGPDPAAAARSWWTAHPDVTPFDPWMPALEARKID